MVAVGVGGAGPTPPTAPQAITAESGFSAHVDPAGDDHVTAGLPGALLAGTGHGEQGGVRQLHGRDAAGRDRAVRDAGSDAGVLRPGQRRHQQRARERAAGRDRLSGRGGVDQRRWNPERDLGHHHGDAAADVGVRRSLQEGRRHRAGRMRGCWYRAARHWRRDAWLWARWLCCWSRAVDGDRHRAARVASRASRALAAGRAAIDAGAGARWRQWLSLRAPPRKEDPTGSRTAIASARSRTSPRGRPRRATGTSSCASVPTIRPSTASSPIAARRRARSSRCSPRSSACCRGSSSTGRSCIAAEPGPSASASVFTAPPRARWPPI